MACTKRIKKIFIYSFILVITIFQHNILFSADWPQFRGPKRNGISVETGLKNKWSENGPELLWSFEGLGAGFSSVAISNGKIYVTGEVDKEETLFAFDLNGKLVWQTTYGPNWKSSYPEVRTTPTVEANSIYVNSGMGKVVCFEAKSGKINWQVQAVDQFGGEYHSWGIAESPLLVDNLVIVTPGGPDASLIALDKNSGKKIWTSEGLSEKGNYCSPILVAWGGRKIVATMLENVFVGVDAESGKVLWKDQFSDYQDEPKGINPVSPLYHNGQIYTTSGYDDGGAMYELSGEGTSIKRIWTDQVLDIHHGGAVLVDGYIYGANWKNNRDGNWVCLDWKTGKKMYEKEWITKGSIIYADGMLYCYEEKSGNLALVEATPNDFNIISSFKVPLGSKQHWAHPAISDGRLYVRHGDALMVYDIKAN
jgi:outer membrane protein assembly factor BamB